MKKKFFITFIFLLVLTSPAYSSSKLKLNLENINATLDEGFGQITLKKAQVIADPIDVTLDNIYYDLSMKENFFIIEGPGQNLKLDLKSFRRIFEQQKFNAVNSHIDIEQGKQIILNSEYFDIALEKVKLNFFGAIINCSPEVGRDITEEILSLCLKKADVHLKQGILSGLEDQVYQWSREIFGDQKLRNLPKFARPVLTNGVASIKNGEAIIRADLKILFTMKLSGTGFVEYQSKEDIITLKINTLASESINLKWGVLKALSLIQNDFFSVDEDVLVFNLAEMRVSGRE